MHCQEPTRNANPERKTYPFLDQNRSRTILFEAARTYIASALAVVSS